MRRTLALAIFLPALAMASPAWGQGNPTGWAGRFHSGCPGPTRVAMASPAWGQGNPSGTGPPSQSCQQQTASPGQASTSPGAPFNEPTSTSPGGTGGQNYSPSSQYDVACYQVSNPPGH